MIIIKLSSGLGNQMFQVALFLALKSKNKNVKVDAFSANYKRLNPGNGNGFEIESVFNISLPKASKVEINTLKINDSISAKFIKKIGFGNILKKETHYTEPCFEFDPNIFNIDRDVYLDGYWQSPKYFCGIETQIKNTFSFPMIEDEMNIKVLNSIISNNSISVHVRRGDYINNSLHGNICNKTYYDKSINYINKHTTDPIFYFFSDDINWCAQNFKMSNAVFVDWNNNSKSYIDLQLMSKCKHNIIANSTFSWWAAYLNDYIHKIVITPNKWFNNPNINCSDIYIDSWIKI